MKELKDLTEEELRDQLKQFRLQRASGFDRKPRGSRKRPEPTYEFKGAKVDDDLAALVLAALKEQGKI